MNETIIKEIATNLNIKIKQVEVVLSLLQDGNTIPFIARYRKEATGALDEEEIRKINEELVEVEDLYRPFKEKKKTKATEAIKNGLEPLSKTILKLDDTNIEKEAEKYLNDTVKTIEDAIMGAKYIIAEIISDNAEYRKSIREFITKFGVITTKIKKKAVDEKKLYEMYYDYSEKVSNIKPHRILAINRAEKEGIITVSIDIDKDKVISYLERKELRNNTSKNTKYIKEAIEDSFKRLIFPSVEREIRSDLKLIGEDSAIDNFSKNVENLLLTPPIKEKVVLGYDPAFRTGCKLAVLDPTGKPLEIAVIYPTEPHNKIEESKKKVLELIDKYNIDIIAIGNGTASRESEKFIADTIKEAKRKVEYIIVNEAGASVYSASKLAIEEFPDLTVEKRSAISIGRRLQDALSELVKIDPKSIGVGLYQHDVTPKKLDESLDFVVSKVVNGVGVNINTASPSLLKYISGLNKKAINAIIEERNIKGKITSRDEIKNIKGITPKIYEQSIGFMRVIDGSNPLDKTSIHPESYSYAEKLLENLSLDKDAIGTKKLQEALKNINIEDKAKELGIDIFTLIDIIEDLKKPNRDPRDSMPSPILKSDVLDIKDLKLGMKLQGTVRNVVDFGVFIDIGLHNDGLAHISKLTNKYIKHPSEVVSVGDIVDCYVIDINVEKEKVSLSLVE